MNETTIGATKGKTAKSINDPFGMSNYEMPKMEVPAQFREMTDKGVAHARDTYAKAKVASEEAADLLKTPMRPLPRAPRSTISSLLILAVPTLALPLTTPMRCWV